jgi:hypothetical protein
MTSRFFLCSLLLTAACPAAVIVDNFSGSLSSEYVQTRVNDNDTTANVSYNTTGGTLNATYAGTNNFEQLVLLRNDYQLTVGETLTASLSSFAAAGGSTADLGIVVASTEAPTVTPGTGDGNNKTTRNTFDWLAISVRGQGVGGFLRMNYFTTGGAENGDTGSVSNLTEGAPTAISDIKALFITRTTATTFEVGFINQLDTAVVLATRSFTATNVGNAIGFYTDLRVNGGSVSGLDNLAVVPEPGAALLGAFGLLALLRRRRA